MSTPVLSSEPEATPPSANLSGVLTLMEDLVSEVAEESRAKTTRYQQGQQWKTFSEWCDERGLQSLPADPETVAVFIFTQGIGGKKPNTLRGYASSIAAEHRSEGHDSPCTDRVAMVIKGFVNRAKEAGQREKRAKPLTGEDLEKIRETACNPRKTDRGMERFSNARRRGLVDIALISVMRDALLRRSEAAEILGNTSPPSRTAPAPLGQANDARVARLRTSVRRAIIRDTGLPQELAKQMREVTRQIAGLTNELERLLPRDRYIRDRPTNAPPAGCSDDSALSTVASMVDSAR